MQNAEETSQNSDSLKGDNLFGTLNYKELGAILELIESIPPKEMESEFLNFSKIQDLYSGYVKLLPVYRKYIEDTNEKERMKMLQETALKMKKML